MKIKCGVDIVEIERIEKAIKNPRILDRILTENEKKYVESKTGFYDGKRVLPVATIAGIYAAKEAISKALGEGLLRGVGFGDIEIDHTDKGEPIVNLGDRAKKAIGKRHSMSISISHNDTQAIAFCNLLIL